MGPISRSLALFAGAGLALAACSLPPRLAAVPDGRELGAVVMGMEDIRYYPPDDVPRMIEDGIEAYEREIAWRQAQGLTGRLPPAHFLAISGGGEDGAFGAGLLNGWTETGTRPEFKIVTGISTGALSAPFAFLGPDYDDELKEVYTDISAKDVLEPRGLLAAVTNDALADNSPLRATVSRFVDEAFLERIAEESRKGRILMIGTTNIDARRGVIWNVGKIAERGGPRAVELVRDILIASAAIPGAFPPSMIDVEVDGVAYQEMHVDGGASAQVFVYPPSINLNEVTASRGQPRRERHVYVIRNARLDAQWAETERSTLSIAQRAISSLIQTQGVGDLFRIYSTAERDGTDFKLAFIPSSFDVELKEPFDQDYMRQLYALGYELGRQGYDWRKAPPGL